MYAPLYLTPSSGLNGMPSTTQNMNYSGSGPLPPGGISSLELQNISATTPGTYTVSASLQIPGRATPVRCSYPIVIGYKSYMKTFGGDTATGGSFMSNQNLCTQATTGVRGWAESLGGNNYRGSSSQLTISSLLTVNEFYSAAQRTASPLAPKGLTFANTGSAAGNSTYGGGSGQTYCLTDYYNETRDPDIHSGNWNGNSNGLASGRRQYNLAGTQIGASGQITVSAGTQAAVYANGNVYIRNNIVYAGANSWEMSPNFVLIVRGNIYIAPNVTRLDGRYIAQPDNNGNGGRIYTCAGNGSLIPAGQIFQQCGNKLTVYGALIAQDIRFFRVNGTITNGSFGESYSSGNLAEVIVYTPEMYLAPSPLRRPGSQPTEGGTTLTPGHFDSLKSLPPVF